MILYCSTFESSLQPVQVYESTAYSCTRTALYSCTITGRSCTTTVLVQRCIVQYSTKVTSKVKNIKLSKVVVQLHVRSTTTVQLVVLSYFQKYESTKVLSKYFRTKVQRTFESTKVSYEGTVLSYNYLRRYESTFVPSYESTTVYSVQLYTYVVVVLPEVNINVLYVYVYCRICVVHVL